MIFDVFCASVRFNMASSWIKFAEVGDKLIQVGCKLTASWPKLVPRRPKRGPEAAMQARSSFHSGFPVLKKVATHNEERRGSGEEHTFVGRVCLGMHYLLKEQTIQNSPGTWDNGS